MKTMLQSPSIAPRLARLKNMLAGPAVGAAWACDNGGCRPLGVDAPRDVVLVPSEEVLLLPVPLPLPSPAKRLAALPFAIEDRIAERIDAVHLALGGQAPGGEWIAAVVAPEAMARWIAAAEIAGVGDAALLPDALALPVPDAGRWNVLRDATGRILVRLPDGGGFATYEPLFLAMWTAAGRPECDEQAGLGPIDSIALDLRQGIFARPRQGLSATGRRVALVAAAGLLAHGAIAAADTFALKSIAAKRGAELTSQLATAAPGRYAGSDPREAAMVAAELIPAGTTAPPGSFLPLLTRSSAALAPFGATVTVRSLGFDAVRQRMQLEVDLADPSARGGIVKALQGAGLQGRFEGATLIIAGGRA